MANDNRHDKLISCLSYYLGMHLLPASQVVQWASTYGFYSPLVIANVKLFHYEPCIMLIEHPFPSAYSRR